MQSVINSRADLDAIVGTPEHNEFLAMLRGSLWRLEKDDQAQAWVSVEDNATIERFGFTRADFPNATAPSLPAYVLPTREQLIAAIDQQRDAALDAGFIHGDHLYHCDPTFQSQLQAFLLAWAVSMLAPTAAVQIRRLDNTTATMTQGEVGALAVALMAHVQGIYAASWVAKDALL